MLPQSRNEQGWGSGSFYNLNVMIRKIISVFVSYGAPTFMCQVKSQRSDGRLASQVLKATSIHYLHVLLAAPVFLFLCWDLNLI
jgi:hypothetical protein